MPNYATEKQVESLARVVLQGFEGMEKDIRKFHTETEASLARIELRLTEVPYRFELVDLERRVSTIEKKSERRGT